MHQRQLNMIGTLFALGVLVSSTAGLQCYLSTSPISRSTSYNIDGGTVGFVGGSDTNEDVINNIKYTFNEGEHVRLIDCEKEAPGATLCVKQQSSVEGVRYALRACWTDEGESTGCTDFEDFGGLGENISRCFCDTDGCNGGIRFSTNIWVIFALFLFLIFY